MRYVYTIKIYIKTNPDRIDEIARRDRRINWGWYLVADVRYLALPLMQLTCGQLECWLQPIEYE